MHVGWRFLLPVVMSLCAAFPAHADDTSDVVAAAQRALDEGRTADAIGILEPAVESMPDSGPVQVLLGVAYLRDERPLWAIDALARRLEEDPSDCEARAWLAWTWMDRAAIDEADAVLQGAECAESGAAETRIRMLRALAAHYAGDGDAAREALAEVRERDEAFASDRDGIRSLSRRIEPEQFEELTWRFELAGGWTSNALLGSPSDPTIASDSDGGLISVDAWLRVSPEFGFPLRPAIELQPKLVYFPTAAIVGQSHFDLTGRIGTFLDFGMPRILLAYRPDWVLLIDGVDAGDPGPLPYVFAHRGEIEAEVTSWLLAFAGAGTRTFFEMGRNRIELDGGLGGRVPLAGDSLALLWSVSGRGYWAQNVAYDVGGASAVLSLQYRWLGGWSTRAGLTLAGDWYPQSAGAFDDPDARRDLFLKAGAAIWTRDLGGVRFGATYDFATRDSTVDSYGFSDHRVLIRVNWSGGADLTGPSESDDRPLAEIDWGGESGGALDERVQDLLRQEDQIYRSCGCVE